MPDLVAVNAEVFIAILAPERLFHGMVSLVYAHVGNFRVFILAMLAVNHLALALRFWVDEPSS